MGGTGTTTSTNNGEEEETLHQQLLSISIVGDLSPGCTVLGTEMIVLSEDELQRTTTSSEAEAKKNVLKSPDNNTNTNYNNHNEENPAPISPTNYLYFLRIESPRSGYILYRYGENYNFLSHGLPLQYTSPSNWLWRVTCHDGAFVRKGLELNSKHIATLPRGSLVKVTRKTVNAMGLSRLRVEIPSSSLNDNSATNSGGVSEPLSLSEITENTQHDVTGANIATDLTNHNNNNTQQQQQQSSDLLELDSSSSISGSDGLTTNTTGTNTPPTNNNNNNIEIGWVSECLNPLSGQRGNILQPLPFPIPVLFRVLLDEGAVIRSGVELSSSQIRIAPKGSILKIVGRAFSNHPMDYCIDRLKLSGNGGWVSVRLNRPPPNDDMVLELVDVDGSFDPDQPGLYHLREQEENYLLLQREREQEQQARQQEYNNNTSAAAATALAIRQMSLAEGGDEDGEGDISEDDNNNNNNSFDARYHDTSSSNSKNKLPQHTKKATKRRTESGAIITSSNSGTSGEDEVDERCLICLTEERTSTIVHGSTGHIACCLACARILFGRGDKCPVCRLPIDSVIQQFWA